MEPGLRLQHVNRDSRAAPHALVLEVELLHDIFFCVIRELDQPDVAQDLEISRDAFEHDALRAALELGIGDRFLCLGAAVHRLDAKAAEDGLCDRDGRLAGTARREFLAFRERATARAIDVLVAKRAGGTRLGQEIAERAANAFIGRRRVFARAFDLGMAQEKGVELLHERSGVCANRS